MKLELNVVRMTNEDVIATSGVCSHINQNAFMYGDTMPTNHIKVSGTGDIGMYYDLQQNGQLFRLAAIGYSGGINMPQFSNVTAGGDGWYHWDSTTNKFVKCSDQSDEAHPLQSN